MAPHSSTLAWKIPWMEEPGGLQSMGSLESDMTERLPFHFSLSCIGEGNGNPLQYSPLENSMDRGAWQATVHQVTKSQTRLKRLSSSSSRFGKTKSHCSRFLIVCDCEKKSCKYKFVSKNLKISVCINIYVCVYILSFDVDIYV